MVSYCVDLTAYGRYPTVADGATIDATMLFLKSSQMPMVDPLVMLVMLWSTVAATLRFLVIDYMQFEFLLGQFL